MPKVSVILPVFNGELFLRDAIESVLAQTFADFELLIMNDGSSDGSEEIILSFNDPRIRYFKNEQNLGIVRTLNKGISLSVGQFIARMDADDVCRADRLQFQLQCFERDPDLGVCGSWLKIPGTDQLIKYPAFHQEILDEMLVSNALAHPVVMFRRELWDKHCLQYREQDFPAEDYMLWVRMAQFTRFFNIQEPLLQYRIHAASISQSKMEEQLKKVNEIRAFHLLNSFGLSDSGNVELVNSVFSFNFANSLDDLGQLKAVFQKVLKKNSEEQVFSTSKLEAFLRIYWYNACKAVKIQPLKKVQIYYSGMNPLFSFKSMVKLFAFTLLRN